MLRNKQWFVELIAAMDSNRFYVQHTVSEHQRNRRRFLCGLHLETLASVFKES